jgi:hypothetical protein
VNSDTRARTRPPAPCYLCPTFAALADLFRRPSGPCSRCGRIRLPNARAGVGKGELSPELAALRARHSASAVRAARAAGEAVPPGSTGDGELAATRHASPGRDTGGGSDEA